MLVNSNFAFGQSSSSIERMSLRTDRDVYIAGEELFFKCYRLGGSNQKSSISSKYAYLVLRNEKSSLIIGICMKLENDMFSGSVYLPDTLSTGRYQLVSFTNYMKNFGEDIFYTKEILVANRFDKDLLKIYAERGPVDTFPKTDTLTPPDKSCGLLTVSPEKEVYTRHEKIKVDIKALGINDDVAQLSVSVHEKVLVQNNSQQHNITVPDTVSRCSYLPEIKGVFMDGEVFKPGNKQAISSNLTSAFANKIYDENTPVLNPNAVAEIVLGLIVNMSHKLYNGSEGIELRGKSIGIHVYGGIGKYIALIAKGFGMEVFAYDPFVSDDILRKDGVKPVKTPDELYSKCQYVSVHLPATWETNGSINFNLLSRMPKNSMLINTACQGIIDEADLVKIFEARKDFRYVTTVPPENASNLAESYPDRFFYTSSKMGARTEEANIIDVLVNFRQNHMVYLSTPDTISNLQFIKTNSTGKFSFLLSDYYNNRNLIISLPGNTNGKIKLADKYELKSVFKPSLAFDESLIKDYLHKSQNIVQIQKSINEDSAMVRGINKSYGGSALQIYSPVSNKIYPADFVSLPDFVEISREILPFLKVRKHDTRYEARLLNQGSTMFFEKAPLILLDGVPIENIDQVINLGSDKIKRIETICTEWFYGGLYFSGILAIFSKNMEINNINAKSSELRIKYMQLQPESGWVDKKQSKLDRTPKFRQLLYWEPSLSIRANEKKTIEFFASDNKGEFEISVDGITSKGKLVKATTTIKITSNVNKSRL